MRKCDAAWLAGVIDGEGCVHERKDGNVELSITQNDRRLLYHVRRVTGLGHITRDDRSNKWRVYARENVRYVLAKTLPFLILKKNKARRILAA